MYAWVGKSHEWWQRRASVIALLHSALLGPFRTTTYFPKRNISEKLLSYPACYCINLRCLFQTLYHNAFSSLRDRLWYSLLRSSSDPYWNWVLSAPLHEMLWMPQGQCLFAHKRELLIETWGIKSQCMLGQRRVTNDGKGEPLLLLCFRQCFTRLKSTLKLGPFRTTAYFPKRNISEKLLSYPACYCINLRCLFQTLYRNAFSSLRDRLWYSLLPSSSDPYWNLVLSGPLYVILWMPQGQCFFAQKRELLMDTLVSSHNVCWGRELLMNDGKGEPL